MINQNKDKRIIQSSKNSTTLLKKFNEVKNKNNIKNRKDSNEKYKTQIINQIYNKHFLFQNNNNQHFSINNINNKSNYNNFISKRGLKKNLLKNFQNNKSISQKNNIILPMKKNGKDKLKIKTKLYGNYTSIDLSKNNLKQTNSTTEVNMSLNENNNVTEEQLEKKKDKIKKKNENKNKYNSNDDNLILINISNNSNSKKKEKNKKNNIRRKLSSNNIYKKKNDNSSNKIVNVISNISYKRKKIKFNGFKKSNHENNKIIEKKFDAHSFQKLNDQKTKINKKNWETKNNETQIQKKNNIFDTFKENKGNYYYLVVSDSKFENRNNKEKQKFRNLEDSISINNNRTYHIEKIPKYIYKKDLSPIPNLNGENTFKLKEPYNKILLVNNNETIAYDREKLSLNNINKIADEQSVSERNNNKYKNIIINKIILNNKPNKTIYKKSKILKNNNKSNIIKYNEIENNEHYLENILKHYEYRNEKKFQIKKDIRIKKEIIKNITDIENRSKNLHNSNLYPNKNIKASNIIKYSNSNTDINFNNTTKEKYNIKGNNIIMPNNIKKANKKENKSKNIIRKEIVKTNKDNNNNREKNDLNQNFFENFKDNNNSSIFISDEDNKTNKEEEEKENSPHINKLVTYFNDAKKTLKNSNLFYKNKNSKTFLDIISPNKSTVISNYSYNKVEDDELSNRTIKVPIFVDVNLLNDLVKNNTNDKNMNFEIKNLYDIISKLNNYKPKKYFLNFLDDKSLMILSSTNRQFYINLRIMFYNNIYKKIFNDKKYNFISKIKISTFSYSSNEIKNCEKVKLKEKYESYGHKKSKYDYLIKQDINRTFPYDPNFAKYREKLYNFLTRYSNYNTSIGYAQGLNFIVANALSYFEKEEEVFLFIDGLINLFKLENYMGENNSTLVLRIKKFSNIISKYTPDVIKDLENKLLSHDFFSISWILTLFSNSMNSQNLMITWCFMIVFGWKFFYCFVIQILSFYKNDIYKTSENNLSKKMKKLLKEERFNNDIKKIINNTLYFMSQNIII